MTTSISLKIPCWLDFICACPLLLYRRLKFGFSYRKIFLSEGKYAKVDQKDYYWLNSYKWIVYGNRNNFYAVRNVIIGPNQTKTISMHRLIMNPPDDMLVDHRNCDSLDNRGDNLRNATHSQNMQNRRKWKNTSSQYRGVSKFGKKWRGQIIHKGKSYWLGLFEKEVDAAKAYDKAAKRYYGEFTRLNFP